MIYDHPCQILHLGPTGGLSCFNQIEDMSFNGLFSYPRCRYLKPIGGSGFNLIEGHAFEQDIFIFSL